MWHGGAVHRSGCETVHSQFSDCECYTPKYLDSLTWLLVNPNSLTAMSFGGRAPTGPARGAYNAPQTSSCI